MNTTKQQINYTQVSNYVLYNPSLSLKAKGLYAYLYSKPESWELNYDIIQQELKENKDAIKNALNELEKAKIILKHQKKDNEKFNNSFILLTLGNEQENLINVKTTPLKDVDNKTKDSTTKTDNLLLREKFEEFWKIYPARKNGKENIFKKYCKVIKDKKYTVEDLKRAATIYREEHTQDNFQYVCGIDKWFNQQYYVGILEANKPKENYHNEDLTKYLLSKG